MPSFYLAPDFVRDGYNGGLSYITFHVKVLEHGIMICTYDFGTAALSTAVRIAFINAMEVY